VAVARYSEIGFIIPAAVILGFFFGKLLDYWLHTRWFTVGGVIFGAVVGFAQMISHGGRILQGQVMTGSGAEDVPSCRPDPEDFFGGATRRIPKFLLSITAALVLPCGGFSM